MSQCSQSLSAMLALSLAVGWFPAPTLAQPASPSPAAVAEPPIERDLGACFEKDPSNAGMIACTDEAARRWEAEIERTSKEIQPKLPEAAKSGFKAAQAAWVKFRDAEFASHDALYRTFDGTMYRLMHASRRKEIIRQRAEELQRTLDVLNEASPAPAPSSR